MHKVLSSLVLLGLIILAGLYFYYSGRDNGNGDHLAFEFPETIYVGVPFDLVIDVSNNSTSLWQDVKLSLNLPADFVFFGGISEKNFEIKSLGNLGGGSLTKAAFKIMKIIEKGPPSEALTEEREIEALLGFSPEGIGSRFEERKTWTANSAQSALELKMDASEKIVSGEKFDLKVNYKNISGSDLENLYLKIKFPESFSWEKTNPDVDQEDGVWLLGSLRNASEGEFIVTGKLLGNTTSSLEFDAVVLRAMGITKNIIAKEKISIAVSESPLIVSIDLNESPDYIAKPGDVLNYAIGYEIAKDITGSDKFTIKAKLIGSIFELSSVNIGDGGSIQPGSNQIVWNLKGRDSEGGSITFSVRVKNDYGIKRLGDRNFVLKIEAEAASGQYSSKAELQTKVAGKITINSQAYFRDAEAGILNSGPMPPKVGQPTNFTVHWQIVNYANDVKEVALKTQLQPGVLMTDFAKSSIDVKPNLDVSNNEIIWKINRINATTGVIGKPIEAVFQIQATPAQQSIGQYMPLLGEIKLTAIDDFTGAPLEVILPALTTALPDDPTVGASGIVVQ